MHYLENEVFLRAAISNVADIRGAKVKFKGFDINSYRRSLAAHLRKLLGNDFHVSLHADRAIIIFPSKRIFSDTPIDEKTNRINELLFKPYILGEAMRPIHNFYAYNASGYLKALYRLRDYMANTEYLFDTATSIDSSVFPDLYYQASYCDYDMALFAESRVAYHDFVMGIAFDTPTVHYDSSHIPYLATNKDWFYHNKEDVVLLNLRETFFDQDMKCESFSFPLPYRALLDRELLTIIASMDSDNSRNNDE